MSEDITIRYTCNGCGLNRVEVAVPVREHGQDVLSWIKGLQRFLSADHARRSPLCASTKCDIMVPHGGRDMIGGPVKH